MEVAACGLAATDGSPCKTKKEAEQSAAGVALNLLCGHHEFFKSQAARKTEVAPLQPGPVTEAGTHAMSLTAFQDNKSKLCKLLQQLLKRSLALDDVRWAHFSKQGLFLASVEVPACGLVTEGSACKTKKEAEQSAAGDALRLLERSNVTATGSTSKANEIEPVGPLSLPCQENTQGERSLCILLPGASGLSSTDPGRCARPELRRQAACEARRRVASMPSLGPGQGEEH